MTDHSIIAMRALAAQHLVAADLLCRGYNCSMAAEGLRYDLIADIHGLRRIQVKMTTGLQMQAGYQRYRFWGGGMNQKLKHYIGDIDLFAFIALDVGRIKYAFPENVALSAAAFKPNEFDLDRVDAAWQAVISRWGPGQSTPNRAPDLSTAIH